MRRNNPNMRVLSARQHSALRSEETGPAVGDLVRVLRDNGAVEDVRVLAVYTSPISGIPMLTVRHSPFGLTRFTIRADTVLPEAVAEPVHEAAECWPPCPRHLAEYLAAQHIAEEWS